MLEKLLERISEGGSFTSQSLAIEFGVSKELMEAMLADLGRSGRLQSIENCEDRDCSQCSFAVFCRGRGKTWVVDEGTEKVEMHQGLSKKS
jgi:hypothetical protein